MRGISNSSSLFILRVARKAYPDEVILIDTTNGASGDWMKLESPARERKRGEAQERSDVRGTGTL